MHMKIKKINLCIYAYEINLQYEAILRTRVYVSAKILQRDKQIESEAWKSFENIMSRQMHAVPFDSFSFDLLTFPYFDMSIE